MAKIDKLACLVSKFMKINSLLFKSMSTKQYLKVLKRHFVNLICISKRLFSKLINI